MITIEPASTIQFLEFLNYNWIPNPNLNTTGFFTGFGYNPNYEQDYKIIQESNPNQVWTVNRNRTF
jgi:hypothetical protein